MESKMTARMLVVALVLVSSGCSYHRITVTTNVVSVTPPVHVGVTVCLDKNGSHH